MAKTERFIQLVKDAGITPHTIYDLGAFDGTQTRELALAWPKATVFAFEADPNHALTCLGTSWPIPNVRVIPYAVGDAPGQQVFHQATSGNYEYGSLLKPNGKFMEPMPVSEITINVVRLESVIDEHFLPPPNLIWMDVQGSEFAVLTSLGAHLKLVEMIWAEVAYAAYYEGQILAPDFDFGMGELGFEKIFEADGIPGWFGDACYRRKRL